MFGKNILLLIGNLVPVKQGFQILIFLLQIPDHPAEGIKIVFVDAHG